MRELIGVMHFGDRALELKKYALLFDRLDLWYDGDRPPLTNVSQSDAADFEFLRSHRVINEIHNYWLDYLAYPVLQLADDYSREVIIATEQSASQPFAEAEEKVLMRDSLTRAMSGATDPNRLFDFTPICERPLPSVETRTLTKSSGQSILKVAMNALPAPDDNAAWQDIFAFKADLSEKQWGFRRFLHSLALKPQGPGRECAYVFDARKRFGPK